MCHESCLDFVKQVLKKEDIEGRSVLEIGSLNVNGSARHYIESLKPSKYLGVDIAAGQGVDEICSIYDIVDRYRSESFDVVISTEVMEHVKNWQKAISNMKQVVRKEGTILLTTRSAGFAYHGWPYDFWRYELSDISTIFSDFDIQFLENDSLMPGILMKAIKPKKYKELNLSDFKLYSIVGNKRALKISRIDYFLNFYRIMPWVIKEKSRSLLPQNIKDVIKKLIK